MVIKFSSDAEALAYEIKVLGKIHRSAQTNSPLPKVIAFGAFIAMNIHKADLSEPLKNGATDKVVAYYIMPKYQMTLREYII